MQMVLLLISAYICGSVPSGKLAGWFKHVDIQKKGSGNIGFANAVRVLGWRIGLVVLLADILKGMLPTLLAVHYLGRSNPQLLLVGLMPILGHAFPVWLRFRGGKSIATGFGVLLVLAPWLALAALAVYALVFVIFRQSFMGSLAAAWSLPFMAATSSLQFGLYGLALAGFATYTHRRNIQNYLKRHAG